MTEHQHHANIHLFNKPITHNPDSLSTLQRAKPSTLKDERRRELCLQIEEAVAKRLGPMRKVKE